MLISLSAPMMILIKISLIHNRLLIHQENHMFRLAKIHLLWDNCWFSKAKRWIKKKADQCPRFQKLRVDMIINEDIIYRMIYIYI